MTALALRFVRAFGCLLYHLHLHRAIIWLHRKQPKVVLYHACEPLESDFLRGLHSNTTPTELATHLHYLTKHYRPVTLHQLSSGTLPEYACLIVFDDGYRSVYTGAWPLLKAAGVTATVYLVADALDNGALIWVNALLWLLHRHPREARVVLQEELGLSERLSAGDLVRIVQAQCTAPRVAELVGKCGVRAEVDLGTLAGQSQLYLSSEEIGTMALEGATFGNHTTSHPNLALLTAQDQAAEVTGADYRLSALPGWIPSLAYPFGIAGAPAREAARSLGYTSFMLVGGTNRELDPLRVARVPVGSATVAELFSDIEVVAPLKEWIRTTRSAANRALRWTAGGRESEGQA
jgi:peptidoglycan/xylan/chitin deacetylase (PgdA/CDA1 family)